MIAELKFGPWLPEQTDYKNPGLEDLANAIPSPDGFNPAYGLTATAATVTGTILGARGLQRKNGAGVIVVATTSDLYVIVSGVANASGLGLSLTSTDVVVFEQYEGQVYATSKAGDTWYLTDIETDVAFSAVAGTVPHGNAIGRVGDFLVMGNLTDIDTSDAPYRLRWSQFNNPAGDWTTDKATQADFQDMDAQQGVVTAISGGTFGLVFQEFGISRMDYNGRSSVFSLDLYEKNRGCIAPQSVVRVGDRAFFLSNDGFFETDGAATRPISRGKIWEWFLATANKTYLDDVSGAVDWEQRCCVWLFASGGDAAYTDQLWYNWETDSWGYVNQALETVVVAPTDGTTLDALDAIYGDLDSVPVSLDSPIFRPGKRRLRAFSGGALSDFTGTTLAARFETGSLQIAPGHRTFIRGLAPLVANESKGTLMSIAYRDQMTKSYTTSPSVAIGPLGYAAVNVDGRYFRVKTEIPAGEEWFDAYGVQVEHVVSGAY